MKMLSFYAENFMRLRAVSIAPHGNVVEITGRNGQGKSSVLNGIRAALGGKNFHPTKPIRKGEERGLLRCELGNDAVELIVTVTFRDREGKIVDTIKVENPDGSRHMSPQRTLNALVSTLTFDPFSFTRLKPAAQFDVMRQFVPAVDFAEIERANRDDYAARTDVNRRAKEARTRADAIRLPSEPLPARVDEEELVAHLEGAGRTNAEIEATKLRREQTEQDVGRASAAGHEYRARAADLRRQADQADVEASACFDRVKELTDRIANVPALPAPVDTSALTTKIAEARRTNAAVDQAARDGAERERLSKIAGQLESEAGALTTRMTEREDGKRAAIAEAKLPVDGLTFGDGEILLNDLPFDQASKAEQIRASFAIAAAQSPELRIAFIDDGSLLDDDNMALVGALAEERDIQVWVERVDASGKVGFVIEDGHVAGQEIAPPQKAEPAPDPEPRPSKPAREVSSSLFEVAR